MKRLFFVFSLFSALAVFAQSPNPVVNRLSDEEIWDNRTPASVAYNYVRAISQENYEEMESYMIPEYIDYSQSAEERYAMYHESFSTPGKLNILGWQDAIGRGYEIAVLYVQTTDSFTKKVYVNLVATSEVGISGSQDITLYDYNVNPKVVLSLGVDNRWYVLGFK